MNKSLRDFAVDYYHYFYYYYYYKDKTFTRVSGFSLEKYDMVGRIIILSKFYMEFMELFKFCAIC